jgi:predicted restriction endonuclease
VLLLSDHSWKVIGTVATKTLDKSSFLHRGSGIPTDIRHFFSAENLTAGQKIYITLKHSDQAYSAYIEMSRSNRTRIFWSKDFSQLLRNSFSNYYNSLLAGAIPDAVGFQKRRTGHKVFADKVKLHYNYTCALSGIRAKDFLVASHIIPWSEKKETRLDPSNGICLSVFFDKAFDKGYITITSSYRVKISEYCDPTIAAVLASYNNKNITLPKTSPPNKEYLQWHNEHIFESFLK